MRYFELVKTASRFASSQTAENREALVIALDEYDSPVRSELVDLAKDALKHPYAVAKLRGFVAEFHYQRATMLPGTLDALRRVEAGQTDAW